MSPRKPSPSRGPGHTGGASEGSAEGGILDLEAGSGHLQVLWPKRGALRPPKASISLSWVQPPTSEGSPSSALPGDLAGAPSTGSALSPRWGRPGKADPPRVALPPPGGGWPHPPLPFVSLRNSAFCGGGGAFAQPAQEVQGGFRKISHAGIPPRAHSPVMPPGQNEHLQPELTTSAGRAPSPPRPHHRFELLRPRLSRLPAQRTLGLGAPAWPEASCKGGGRAGSGITWRRRRGLLIGRCCRDRQSDAGRLSPGGSSPSSSSPSSPGLGTKRPERLPSC